MIQIKPANGYQRHISSRRIEGGYGRDALPFRINCPDHSKAMGKECVNMREKCKKDNNKDDSEKPLVQLLNSNRQIVILKKGIGNNQ